MKFLRPLRERDSHVSWARRGLAAAAALALLGSAAAFAAERSPNVIMPAPADAHLDYGRLAVTPAFTFTVEGADDGRIRHALDAMVQQWSQRTGYVFGRAPAASAGSQSKPTTVTVEAGALAAPVPAPNENESYTLEITADHVHLQAPTSTGALRGIASLTQLLQGYEGGWFIPTGSIKDAPRFAWRGLLIDPARHWIPVAGVKRTLDGMALVKLNVLHLHLTDDQGFRIESKRYPKLHSLGSDGHYYTQDEMRDLIAYAAARGIRIVPEFDLPGHATTWAVAYPELASAPGPYAISHTWGVHDVVLDPTNEQLYPLLDGFIGEMAALFPDPYLHIGGDENNGRQWNANPHIQAFKREHSLADNAALQAYFNRRLQAIVTQHGKKMIGWDEILHPDLPPGTVIQSWRGANGLANATRLHFAAILSHGYYLDHMLTAAEHYAVDPIPAGPLPPEQQQLILGGEACMWGEWATAETLDSRTWPRAAAVAERLWSPRTVTDVDDMYRRLDYVSQRLEDAGLRHVANREALRRQFAGAAPGSEVQRKLDVIADLFVGGGLHVRATARRDATQATPLTEFADCAATDSALNRSFAHDVHAVVFASGTRPAAGVQALAATLATWQALGAELAAQELAPNSPRVCALAPLGQMLVKATQTGRDALADLARGGADPAVTQQRLAALNALARPQLGVTLPLVAPLRQLVAAAAAEPSRIRLKPAEWSAEVERLAAPPVAHR